LGDDPCWAADLVGLPVEEAETRVRATGMASRRVFTAPPWAGEGAGAARVVRVRESGSVTLELTAAWEDYIPAPRKRPDAGGLK